MDKAEAKLLVEKCLPRFAAVGLPQLDPASIKEVKARPIATLWAGMGHVYELSVLTTTGQTIALVAKRIQLPAQCDSIGDQRKKDSYNVEAAFYSQGHAERLNASGCIVPSPLHVDTARGEGLTICMTKLEGSSSCKGNAEAFLTWLARLHAAYWGPRADSACGEVDGGGLQAQGCYWHLDTRPEEHRRMTSSGWMGRLKLAARAIDLRLKADPLQTVCHGDAKGANIMYASESGRGVAALVYDFQYCGKAPATKDLSYFFNVDVCPSAAEEERLIAFYHQELLQLLEAQGDTPPSMLALKTSLELALCDWRRFTEVGLGGWGDSRANHRVQEVLTKLDGGQSLGSEDAYIEAMQREFPV